MSASSSSQVEPLLLLAALRPAPAHASVGAAPVAQQTVAPAWRRPFYVSIDSAPRGFTARRSGGVPILFLVLFALLSAGVAVARHSATSLYAHLLSGTSGVPVPTVLRPGTLSVRPFVVLLICLLAVFALGSIRSRVRFLIVAVSAYATTQLCVDTLLMDNRGAGLPTPLSQRGGIAAVLTGLVVLSLIVFTQYRLPEDVRVRSRRSRVTKEEIILFTLLALSGVIDVATMRFRNSLRVGIPLVNGFASSVVFFLVCTQVFLFLVGRLRQRAGAPPGVGTLSVAFLVPAHNEARSVARVVAALDAAASAYPGNARLVLVNNCSTDGTAALAQEALTNCQVLTGDVVDCDTPGKAHALNYGLDRIREDLVIRVDADTLVEPTLLTQVVPHFLQPSTGGVSGIPLPRDDAPGWLRPVRLMEALYAVEFLRVGQGGIDGVLVMPGNMTAYRRELLEQLGGFGVGFNGEDTDAAVRIGRLGYQIVTDPEIEFHTEVPATIAHLREQRARWSRGTFHVVGRNRSCITTLQGARGLFTLPWAFANACRRSVMLPMLVAAGIAGLIAPGMISLRQVAIIGGLLLGIHMATVALLLIARGSFGALASLPTYFAFRIFKLYVAFEALLTLELKAETCGDSAPHVSSP